MRIGNILAVVEKGDYNDKENRFLNVFKANLDDHIRATIAEYNAVTKEAVVAAQEKARMIQENASRAVFYDFYNWGAATPVNQVIDVDNGLPQELIRTTWGQDISPYTDAIKAVMNPPPNTNYKVGHDVTAVTQLVAHWKRVNENKIHKPDSPMRSQYGRGNIRNDVYGYTDAIGQYRNFSAMNYEWTGMTSTPNAHILSNMNYRAEIATLFLQMGCKMDKVFTSAGTDMTPIEYVWNALYLMGYSAYGIQQSEAFDSYFGIYRSLYEEKPVYACASDEKGVYTAWLIDNYRIERISPRHFFISLHCNIGENEGDGNGFFYWAPRYEHEFLGKYQYNLKYITGIEWRE